MSIHPFFDWLQLGVLACWIGVGAGRGLVLHFRGVRVIVVDRGRTTWQLLSDLLIVLVLLALVYEVVARSFSLPTPFFPGQWNVVLVDSIVARALGAAATVAALLVYLLALFQFRDSWRVGIDRVRSGPLVTSGIFDWTRNPIYVAFEIFFIGSFLLWGTAIFLFLTAMLAVLLHLMILREERFRESIHGAAYRDYRERVGRYITWPFRRSCAKTGPTSARPRPDPSSR
jgi:protein-S-isoprenylcysteine O-methyltransferase Ste14